ncbi:MAG: DUF1501 domain-containing protein, partial [Planctomicrobium sp.]|nr:DUF1501 domain-containing protein [Planctomicrobium sp.]
MNISSIAQNASRRQFLEQSGLSLGSIALGNLLSRESSAETVGQPMQPRDGHFPAKIKNVIYMFMAGGPSQLELFEPKPMLNKFHGEA